MSELIDMENQISLGIGYPFQVPSSVGREANPLFIINHPRNSEPEITYPMRTSWRNCRGRVVLGSIVRPDIRVVEANIFLLHSGMMMSVSVVTPRAHTRLQRTFS